MTQRMRIFSLRPETILPIDNTYSGLFFAGCFERLLQTFLSAFEINYLICKKERRVRFGCRIWQKLPG